MGTFSAQASDGAVLLDRFSYCSENVRLQDLSVAYLHICLQLLHIHDVWIMHYGQVNGTSLRPRGHITRQCFMCKLSSFSVRRTEVGGRQSWMLRFHKHIHRFLSQIQGIFFSHSSNLPTVIISELLNFPVTLLGNVRKEYLMPKICVAKKAPLSLVPGSLLMRRQQVGNGWVGSGSFQAAPGCLAARPSCSPGASPPPGAASMLSSLGSKSAPGLPMPGQATDSARTHMLQGSSSQLPLTLRRCWKDDSCSVTRIIGKALYSPGGRQVKITNTKYEKSVTWLR